MERLWANVAVPREPNGNSTLTNTDHYAGSHSQWFHEGVNKIKHKRMTYLPPNLKI